MMHSKDVIEIYNLLEKNHVKIWIDGGWGIDALLGKQTRLHNDLDIAIEHKDVLKLRKLLFLKKFKEKAKSDSTDWNFILADNTNHAVDVHVFEFDYKGNNIYGIAYPAKSLTGTGIIDGQIVRCILLKYVLKFHTNYEPDENDLKDMKALCNKFNVKPPKNYKNRLNFN